MIIVKDKKEENQEHNNRNFLSIICNYRNIIIYYNNTK